MLSSVRTTLLCGLLRAIASSAAQSNDSFVGSQAFADLSSIGTQPLWANGTIPTDESTLLNQSSTKNRSTPLIQILAVGHMSKSTFAPPAGHQPSVHNKAIEAGCSPITITSGNTVQTTKTCWDGAHPQPLFEGAPMTMTRVDSAPGQTAQTVVETAQAEATLIGSTTADWRINLSPTFVHEVIRLANEQCHKAGLSKRQYVDPSIMLCMPGQLSPDSLIQLQDAIRRYAYSEISYDDLSVHDWETNKFGAEEVRIEAASIVELGIMDFLDKSGGYLNGNLVVAPVVAHSWLSSALASRTKPDRYWDFHSRTSSSKVTSSSPSSSAGELASKSTSTDEEKSKSIDDKESKSSSTSSSTISCPLCTESACAVSPDDDQGQDGTVTPYRPSLMTATADPACIVMQDSKDWSCLCKPPKGKLEVQTTAWSTYLLDRSSTTFLVSSACPTTYKAGNPIVLANPLCIPIQDAQRNNDWVCLCQRPKGKFDTYTTNWLETTLHRGDESSLATLACPYTDYPETPIPDTIFSSATCRTTSKFGESPYPVGAQSTALYDAIGTFCEHYSKVNPMYQGYRSSGKGGPKAKVWDGGILTKDYTSTSPAVVNGLETKKITVVVVRLSIKYEKQACESPEIPLQSWLYQDHGDWCKNEMKRVVSQCEPFQDQHDLVNRYYAGGEVNAGCIKFGVEHVTKKGRDEL